eukprot:358020-Chlamydomonas_euryale.AAC.8
MVGSATPSPSPTKQRAASTNGTVSPAATTGGDVASGSRHEAIENQKMPAAMTRLPPSRSASVPPSSCVAM